MTVLAEASANPAPWWGGPLMAGIFTMIGVLAAQSVTWMLDRRRGRREDARRWHADRRGIYARFLTTAEEAFAYASEYRGGDAPDCEHYESLVTKAMGTKMEMKLIAGDHIQKHADDIVLLLTERAPSESMRKADIERGFVREFDRYTSNFVAEARKDLNMESR